VYICRLQQGPAALAMKLACCGNPEHAGGCAKDSRALWALLALFAARVAGQALATFVILVARHHRRALAASPVRR